MATGTFPTLSERKALKFVMCLKENVFIVSLCNRYLKGGGSKGKKWRIFEGGHKLMFSKQPRLQCCDHVTYILKTKGICEHPFTYGQIYSINK